MNMWIFGKKANKQSSKTDVPPELQSYYYAQQAKVARTRLVLSVLILVILIVGGVFGGLWLHSRAASSNHLQVASNQSSQKAKSKSSTQSNHNNSIPVTPPKTTTPAPSSQTPVSQTPSVSTMPNTGPGTEMFLIAGGAGLLGAIFYHFRQVRAVR